MKKSILILWVKTQICVNSLYDEKSDKNRVAYILEMVNDKLSLIKEEFDNITQIN